jgi:cellulose biosynthesis protein BcsQ
MKIKLCVLDGSQEYTSLLKDSLFDKYSDFVDIAVFSQNGQAVEFAKSSGANVFLVDDIQEFDPNQLPGSVSLGYLSTEQNVIEFKGRPAHSKYASIDEFYSFVLKLYSESVKGMKFSSTSIQNDAKLFTFASPNERGNADAIAVGFSKALAMAGKRVLYVDLNNLNTANHFLNSGNSEQGNYSNLIFSLKAKQGNLEVAFGLATHEASTGLYYIAGPDNPADPFELNSEDKLHLIKQLISLPQYDYFVVNAPFGIGKDNEFLFSNSEHIILHSNGEAFEKILAEQAYSALKAYDQQTGTNFSQKAGIVYVHSDSQNVDLVSEIPEIANITSLGEISDLQLVDAIVNFDVFGLFLARYI